MLSSFYLGQLSLPAIINNHRSSRLMHMLAGFATLSLSLLEEALIISRQEETPAASIAALLGAFPCTKLVFINFPNK